MHTILPTTDPAITQYILQNHGSRIFLSHVIVELSKVCAKAAHLEYEKIKMEEGLKSHEHKVGEKIWGAFFHGDASYMVRIGKLSLDAIVAAHEGNGDHYKNGYAAAMRGTLHFNREIRKEIWNEIERDQGR